ncbi:hypothetical protein GFS24_21370 [Chitinophaga sp. SYP-B3965]|uniref:hypothetical protein n=1 Tax=Chitinophaga sp. SYP-B3965 TaxID=2663120 RepID=UPI001299863F|nr:hypothetical protein [Chitinophaga sp. SYP-B3965]MRG47688.1 hypothetical protein [Chitinophaga sp. SYP-B3965]
MSNHAKLPLKIPHSENSRRYFSIRIKDMLLNENSYFQEAGRILVVSAMDGNFAILLEVLYAARVINKKNNWIFGDGRLVILGGCFDKGEHVVECLWLIYDLEEKAKREGGYVHFILGEHEILNLNGNWRHMQPIYATNLRKPGSAYLTLYDGNNELWRWIRTKNIIEKIGNYLFVRGGISSSLVELGYSLFDINRIARNHYSEISSQFSDPLLNILFNSEESPFLYRGYYLGNENSSTIDRILERFNVSNIITRHKQPGTTSIFFEGKIVNLAGSSDEDYYALLIVSGKFFRLYRDGRMEDII